MTMVICPTCDSLLKVNKDCVTFQCPCGAHLQHPRGNSRRNRVENTLISEREVNEEPQIVSPPRRFESAPSLNTSVPIETEESNQSFEISANSEEKSEEKFDRCRICVQKFSLLGKKRRQCRNCERFVCSQCSKQKWPAKMLPKEKNKRREKWLRVCFDCQNRSEAFRNALLEGKCHKAKTIFDSGVTQIFFPYEIYPKKQYPIHFATLSGDLETVKWLVSKRCNPRVTDGEGNTALALAASQNNFEICKFFIFRGYSKSSEIKDVESLQKLLQTCFISLQRNEIRSSLQKYSSNSFQNGALQSHDEIMKPRTVLEEEEQLKLALELSKKPVSGENEKLEDENHEISGGSSSECVVCLEDSVDSVIVPCGHLCCCESCASQLTACPVCRGSVTQVVKTFKT